jgi:hypothetical protein
MGIGKSARISRMDVLAILKNEAVEDGTCRKGTAIERC